MRNRAFHEWQDAAIEAGLRRSSPPDMVVAATDRADPVRQADVLGPHARPVLGRGLTTTRSPRSSPCAHGIVTGVAFGFTHGGVVEIEAMRGAAPPPRQVVEPVRKSTRRPHLPPH